MIDFDNFLKQIITMDVSDIHFRVGEVPVVRRNGAMIKPQF
jgi:Tfp pilus assembly pilus retraction ATPase PilT